MLNASATQIVHPVRRTPVAALAVGLAVMLGLAALTAPANAALIAEESFSYETGSIAGNGSAADPGWGGAWGDAEEPSDGTNAVQLGSLDAPKVDGETGNRATVAGGNNDNSLVIRPLASTFDTGTVYAGLLFRRNNDATRAALFSLFNGNDEHVIVGTSDTDGENENIFALARTLEAGDDDRQYTDTTATKGETFQLVAKVTFGVDSDDDQLDLFVNPDPQTEPTTADVTVSNTDLSFNRVRLFGGKYKEDRGGEGNADFDEIRIADSYAAAFAIPEPTTLALLLLGGVALLNRRPRRRPSK